MTECGGKQGPLLLFHIQWMGLSFFACNLRVKVLAYDRFLGKSRPGYGEPGATQGRITDINPAVMPCDDSRCKRKPGSRLKSKVEIDHNAWKAPIYKRMTKRDCHDFLSLGSLFFFNFQQGNEPKYPRPWPDIPYRDRMRHFSEKARSPWQEIPRQHHETTGRPVPSATR